MGSADRWMLGETAALDDYTQTPPSNMLGNAATAVKDWWTQQPSWLDRAQAENQKTLEAYGRGGMGEIAKQLATDTTEPQELYGAFGVGNVKGVGSKALAPGALAAVDEYRPPFYSAVEQAVQGAKQNAAPGQQWAGYLRNQPGVKPEEVEALGLGKLFEQPGSVPKEAVLGEIAANRVSVGEVVKGGRPKAVADFENFKREIELRHNTHLDSPYDVAKWAGSEAADKYETLLRAAQDAQRQTGPTKFSQYTLPGGENYREMLLTLPSKARAPTSADIKISKDRDPLSGTPMWRANVGDHFVGRYGSQEHAAIEANRWISEKPDNFKEGTFRSSHYDEPNILAHVRYNDRVIDGKKTLFVEEVQSDWHQKGKKQGYKEGEPQTIPSFTADQLKIHETEHQYVGTTPDGRQQVVGKGTVGDEDGAREYLTRYMNKMAAERNMSEVQAHHAKVPDAPFKTTWPELAMKRIIREAAEKGYDKVAWTPGSVQAERYDLSKHIDKISYDGQRLWAWKKGEQGTPAINQRVTSEEELANIIGKDAAEKLLQQPKQKMSGFTPGETGSYRTLEGADLKIGGEGMKGFYDEILPSTVNKLVKKHGGRVQQGKIATQSVEDLGGGYGVGFADKKQPVHTLDITPALREQAMKGFPLFTAGGVAATGIMGEMARQDEYR